MESSYALVLTGEVRPGHAPELVWPKLAAYFRMEPDKFTQQLLARAPLTIKQGDDLGKLQTLQAGAAAVGAEAEICAPDGRPSLFVILDNAARGPMPRVFVEERVEHGLWSNALSVAEVGSNAWKPYREFETPPPPPVAAVAPTVQPPDPFSAREISSTRNSSPTWPVAGGAGGSVALPPGGAIHAGFWRRCAAYLLDALIIGVLGWLVGVLFLIGGLVSSGDPRSMMVAVALNYAIAIAIGWLYYALQESSSAQATLGKRALGVKVTDLVGQRIGFARASGRYFGKILSSLILGIGYLLAGWTARKQALHDMLAGTLVVFGSVQPGQALPTVRPPMPAYGWIINILFLLTLGLGALALWLAAASMMGLATQALHNGTGF
ncbi:MAG: RDD family protein [Dokdonella sp.]